jgi:hypothetical protein
MPRVKSRESRFKLSFGRIAGTSRRWVSSPPSPQPRTSAHATRPIPPTISPYSLPRTKFGYVDLDNIKVAIAFLYKSSASPRHLADCISLINPLHRFPQDGARNALAASASHQQNSYRSSRRYHWSGCLWAMYGHRPVDEEQMPQLCHSREERWSGRHLERQQVSGMLL